MKLWEYCLTASAAGGGHHIKAVGAFHAALMSGRCLATLFAPEHL